MLEARAETISVGLSTRHAQPNSTFPLWIFVFLVRSISCLSQELYLPSVISIHNPSRMQDGSFDTRLLLALLVDARCTLARTH